MQDYDKRLKDLLSQIPYEVDENLLVQWFVTELLQIIGAPLRMHEIKDRDEALKKAQQIELTTGCPQPIREG